MIEYALMVPMIFLLVVNVVNLGGFFYAWISVADAARAGADYAVLGGASAGSLTAATASQIDNVISRGLASLPNVSSLAVNICQNDGGTITTISGACNSVNPDPEPSTYVLTSVDVTYTYQPFIPASFQFSGLNIYATIPPSTIERTAVMRSIR